MSEKDVERKAIPSDEKQHIREIVKDRARAARKAEYDARKAALATAVRDHIWYGMTEDERLASELIYASLGEGAAVFANVIKSTYVRLKDGYRQVEVNLSSPIVAPRAYYGNIHGDNLLESSLSRGVDLSQTIDAILKLQDDVESAGRAAAAHLATIKTVKQLRERFPEAEALFSNRFKGEL